MSADNQAKSARTRWDDLLTIAGFVVALWTPLLLAFIAPAPDESAMENRELKAFPALELDRLDDLPTELEAYYDDRMGLRAHLIRAHAWLWVKVLGRSPSEHLIVGREGWLFQSPDRFRDHYRGRPPLDAEELEIWRRSFEERERWLARQGIAYLVVFVPMKSAVYPEYLPAWVPRQQVDVTGRLARTLRADTQVGVLDLREMLLANKHQERLYHRTDIHWNDSGAYLGYRAILEALQLMLPELAGETAVEVRSSMETADETGLATLLGVEHLYTEEVRVLKPTRPRAVIDAASRAGMAARRAELRDVVTGTGDPDQPTAVVFRDSFATALIPFLSNHFERVVYQLNPDIDPRLIAREVPDVVIHQIWAGRVYGREWGPSPSQRWRASATPWLDR